MLKGLDSINKALDRIAELKGIERGMINATARVEATAKELCPVDDGTLKASITSRVEVEQEVTGIVGTNVDYADDVEFGTYKMSAQPYLFPALELNRKNIANDIAEGIREELNK